jgi:uncharacterized membrane protein
MTNVKHKLLIFRSIYLFIYVFTFVLHVSGFLLAHLQRRGVNVGARARSPYPGDLDHCRSCAPASEDGLKESPKHVRQKKIDI